MAAVGRGGLGVVDRLILERSLVNSAVDAMLAALWLDAEDMTREVGGSGDVGEDESAMMARVKSDSRRGYRGFEGVLA